MENQNQLEIAKANYSRIPMGAYYFYNDPIRPEGHFTWLAKRRSPEVTHDKDFYSPIFAQDPELAINWSLENGHKPTIYLQRQNSLMLNTPHTKSCLLIKI